MHLMHGSFGEQAAIQQSQQQGMSVSEQQAKIVIIILSAIGTICNGLLLNLLLEVRV